MKFNKFIYASMAAALLASCSDKDVIADAPDGGSNSGEFIGDGYVAVNINLPVQLVTAAPRAANDDFNDGTANEYKIEDGALLLFSGATESAATFIGAYELNLDNWVMDDDNDNITSSHLTAVKVEVGEISGNLYGLVMLNYKNVMNMLANTGKNESVTLKGVTDATFNATGTFNDLVGKISTEAFYTKNASGYSYFFMANAPISNNVAQNGSVAPTAGDITTLVKFASDAIKNTEADAKANPAASVFVERAVAKATLSSTATVLDLNGKTSAEDKTQLADLAVDGNVEWALNVTNPNSYIVRNMGDLSFIGYKNTHGGNYRMVGNTKIGQTPIQPVTDFYRTYWCIDPNYTTADLATNPVTYTTDYATANFVAAGNENPLYCHENTFNTASQAHKSTTQAIVRVAFKLGENGGTFYTVNGRQDTIYASVEKAEVFSLNAIINHMDIKNAIAKALENTGLSITLNGENYATYLNIAFARNSDGIREVTDISFKNDAFTSMSNIVNGEEVHPVAPEWSADQNKSLRDRVNKAYVIREYKDGVNYYPVRFKHFAGDNPTAANELAPWDPAKLTILNTETSEDAYPNSAAGYTGWAVSADNMWLGRYGMVRNNWYDVTVSAFKHLGEPEIGSLKVDSDTKPDDIKETEQWIAFKVNVLSWAMRKQQIEL